MLLVLPLLLLLLLVLRQIIGIEPSMSMSLALLQEVLVGEHGARKRDPAQGQGATRVVGMRR